ncbi:MAG TPA: zf-HC2 domain-containing protein [Actinomycetes bacterium]|nr:zf-HC2 domain-containing protein [Actinomycetes bacterium]
MVLTRSTRLRCHQVAKTLQAYLDGEVVPRKADQVAAHLEECRQCGLDAQTYRAIKASIATSYAPDDTAREAVVRLRGFVEGLAAGDHG